MHNPSCRYTATDVLSQTFAQQLTGAKSVQLSLRRIFNSGLTSGFLGGFVGSRGAFGRSRVRVQKNIEPSIRECFTV